VNKDQTVRSVEAFVMSSRSPHLFFLLAFVAAPMFFNQLLDPSQSGSATAAPTIRLQGLDGQTHDVSALRGNVVLVSFGATWCTPCSRELHALEELKSEFAGKPVKFFWVSIESSEDVSNASLKRYAKERRITFPVLRDPEKAAYVQFSARLRLPLIVFFGTDGQLDAPVQFGMRSPADLYKADVRARLHKLLAGGVNRISRRF